MESPQGTPHTFSFDLAPNRAKRLYKMTLVELNNMF